MRPAFQPSSISRQAGAAKRARRWSVVSTEAIVPSKSTNRRHLTRTRETLMEPVDRSAPPRPKSRADDGLFNPHRLACQPVLITFTLTFRTGMGASNSEAGTTHCAYSRKVTYFGSGLGII